MFIDEHFQTRRREKGSNTYMATNVLHFSMLLYKVTLWLDLTKLIQNLNYMATLAYTWEGRTYHKADWTFAMNGIGFKCVDIDIEMVLNSSRQ